MQCFIVMPCLNEEAVLAATCASLGFGCLDRASPLHTRLVLVDNGSEDRTFAVMQDIQRRSPTNSVILASEPERGYVPPRHRGVLVARDAAMRDHCPEDSVLIVQADADIRYQAGYVLAMQRAAESAGPNVMVEAIVKTPPEFAQSYPAYQRLSDRVDASVKECCVSDADDVIVGDAVCAFRLSDYFAWGGHLREFDPDGEEIHAETSRLYMKARTVGASRMRAPNALAWPSRRRVLENAVLYFATIGFPRGAAWSASWVQCYDGPSGLAAFERSDAQMALARAIVARQAHELVLFGVLPAWIAKMIGSRTLSDELSAKFTPLLSLLPSVSTNDIKQGPGRVLHEALSLMEAHLGDLSQYLAERARPL